jgi:serine/threonine protein phosphatase PrpC
MDQRKNVYSTQSKLPRPFNNFNKKNNFKKPVSKRENNKHFILHAPKIKNGEKIVIKKKKSFENINIENPKLHIIKKLSTEENGTTNNNFPRFKITGDITQSQLLTVNNHIKDNHQIKHKNLIIKKKSQDVFENRENQKKKIFILKGPKIGIKKKDLPIIISSNNQNQNHHIQNNLINNEINIRDSLNFNNITNFNNKNNLFNFNNPNHPKKKIKLFLDKNQITNINKNTNFRYNSIIKSFFNCENPNLECRNSMEDYSYTNINFIDIENHKMSLFAIFDGHNGTIVSEFLQKNFAKTLKKNLEKNEFKIEKSIGDSFIEIDTQLKKNNELKMIGSTATIVLIDNNLIYCANVGDSTCFYLSIDEIKQLSIQHNTKNIKEVNRIKKNNGFVFNGKVFGSLSVTRAIGDFDFKEGGVIAIPTISKEEICDKSKFVILASDGLWDVISKDDAFEMSKNMENAKGFCEMLVKDAIDKGTGDNVSCIVIQF